MRIRYSILIPAVVFCIVLLILLLLMLFLREAGGLSLILLPSAGILLMMTGLFYFLSAIFFPLIRFKQKLNSFSKAERFENEASGSAKEFRGIDNDFTRLQDRLKELVDMANGLAEGRIDNDFKALGDDDELGQAILKVKESIQLSNEEALRRRILDEQANWASQGIARFGVILRDFEKNVESLSYTFIRELVEYVEVEVGALFLTVHAPDNTPSLKLTGAYAFDREKLVKKRFNYGEGLVGRCAQEMSSILITDVPEDYIRIRSGMGEDIPSTLLLVPILFDNQVFGVIELASFREIDRYKIDFLESLGQSIASFISKAEVAEED